MHSQLIENDARTSDDLSVFQVPELVAEIVVWSITKENTFLGPWCKFAAIIFRDEGVRLASENPQLVVIRLTADP